MKRESIPPAGGAAFLPVAEARGLSPRFGEFPLDSKLDVCYIQRASHVMQPLETVFEARSAGCLKNRWGGKYHSSYE
jgi:hypothetical protein